MSNIQDSVFGFFVEEAAEHLSVLEDGLLQIEGDPAAAAATIDHLFRAAHTLKGSASLVKFESAGSIAHKMEDMLEAIRDGQAQPTRSRIDAMLFSLDQIRELIRLKTSGQLAPEGLVEQVVGRLEQADSETEVAFGGEAPSRPPAAEEAGAELPERRRDQDAYVGAERRGRGRRIEEAPGAIRIGVEKIEALMGLVGEFTVAKNHLVNQLHVAEKMKDEIDFAGQRLLKEVAGFAERYDYTLPAQAEQQEQEIADFQELEFDRYDELNLFSKKLREITNDIAEALRGMTEFFGDFTSDVSAMDRMTEEMKERISEARTVQAGALFQRFNRSIRDLAADLEKPVELCVAGGETPIDRVVYDGLFDPLLHIIRNSFAHGIEPTEQRMLLGKPATATIWLAAERRGNTVEISVRDDGRGIDLDKVRARAEEKGFVEPGQLLSEQDLIQMIFRPGFSTTSETDTTSGRGVGMNVVMDRLAALSGSIEVLTEQGAGTTFRLRLPLSLVIVNVIQFSVGGQPFVIPSALVNEIQDLAYEAAQQGEEVEAGEPLTKIDLCQRFGLPASEQPANFGILTQSEGTPILLLVDRILGQEDTVIKPFGSFLQELPHFSGSSLAGDGTLRLVVNPARMKYRDPLPESQTQSAVETSSDLTAPKVLVVDDSLSVRKYASMMLEANGLQVLTAADGMEALEILEQEEVSSIVTDLEMPVMHGYELLAELQRREGWRVPVAVLSSRAGEQHQAKALDLGASDYLVKPFEEEALMTVVRRHLRRKGKSL